MRDDGNTPSATVAGLLSVVDPARFLVASHAFDSGAPIARVKILDECEGADLRRGDALLAIGAAVGSETFAELVGRASQVGVALIACRARTTSAHSLVTRLARSASVCIIVLGDDVTWEELNARFRLVLSDALATRRPGLRTPSNSDLFALADTAAMLLNAPVIIDDENLDVVAYSNSSDDVDERRRRSIDELRAEPDVLAWLTASGTIARLRHSIEPCVVPVPHAVQRWATAIRAGSAIVGYVWVASPHPLTSQMSMLLTEIARRAASALAQMQLDRDPGLNSRTFALREALLGNISAARLADAIPIDDVRCARVLGFRAQTAACPDLAIVSAMHSMTSLLLTSEARQAVVVSHGDTVYALALETSTASEHDAAVARLIANRASQRFAVPVHALIGPVVTDAAELMDALLMIPRLHAIAAPDPSTTLVIDHDNYREQLILDELLRFFGGKPHLLAGPVQHLSSLDRTRGTDYVRTLRAFLAWQSDATLAARDLNVHRNTLKYRLARIREIVGTDFLDTAESRMIVLLQCEVLSRRMPSARAVLVSLRAASTMHGT